jgi:hypothetical protein
MLSESQILRGAVFNEPMGVITAQPVGEDACRVRLAEVQSERFRHVTLTRTGSAALTLLHNTASCIDDAELLRLGLQADALGIACEFYLYFGLSILRVDPLPQQLAPVYDHLLKPACVHFLLADDAGAGKTIMSGLLIREIKLCELAKHILIVCPTNVRADTLLILKQLGPGCRNSDGGVRQIWKDKPLVFTDCLLMLNVSDSSVPYL